MNSQSGFISVEFVFAITIAFGMSLLVFALTYTLTVIEVTQYVVYSAARAHAASNASVDEQVSTGKRKYSQLSSSPAIKSLYAGEWFEISPANKLEIRSGRTTFEADYPGGADKNREVFTGVRTTLRANILEMKLPFLGTITPDDDNGFSARVAGILIREPSTEECRSFFKQKVEEVWKVNDGRFARFKGNTPPQDLWEDNGC